MSGGNGAIDPLVEDSIQRAVRASHVVLDAKIEANHRAVMKAIADLGKGFGGQLASVYELCREAIEASKAKPSGG